MGSATSIVRISLQSNQYEQGLRGAKKQFEDFAASIGINMKKLTAYGLAAGAAASAINSMTSAISTAMTEGTRMAKEMEGVRAAFNRLNQPGLLDNLREATHGTVNDLELMKQAVKFDNFNLSLDQMGTMLAFAQQQAKDTGQDVGYLVDSIVTGLGRKSLPILDNLGLSATEIRERMKETGDMTKAVADIIQERMNAAGGYVETAADRAAKATADMENAMIKLGETFGPITQNSDSLWNSIKVGAINALNYVGNLINYLHEAGRISKIIGNMNGGGMMERFGNNLRNSKDPSSLYQRQLAEINRSINSAEAKLQQAEKGGMGSIQIYRERVQALKEIKKQYQELYQTISRPPKPAVTEQITTKTPKGSGKKTTAPTYAAGSLADAQAEVQRLSKLWNEAGADVRDQYLQPLIEAEAKVKSMQNAMSLQKEHAQGRLLEDKPVEIPVTASISDSFTQSVDDIREYMKNHPIVIPIENTSKDVKALQETAKTTAQVVGTIGQAFNAIEDPAAKVAAVVAQAIANIALAYSDSLAKDQPTKSNIFAFIAAAAAATVSMVSTIASIHQATGYARGGVIKAANGAAIPGTFTVPGTTYSNDQIPAMLNAGETVLTRAQAGNIASQLQGAGGSINLNGVLTGENIFLSADRYARRSGRGELVTFHR